MILKCNKVVGWQCEVYMRSLSQENGECGLCIDFESAIAF